ncbi:MAG: hypothetical protein ACRC33_10465 [Gemmataceae bacterium]
MIRPRVAICFALSLVLAAGCAPAGPGAPPAAKVKGTVTLDGKAVPEGELHFGIAGKPPGVVPIKDGTFAGDAPVGKNKVEVFIYTAGPASEKYGGTASKVNSAPGKYWGPNTALDATVAAGGANEFKFEMTSK